MFDEKSRLRSVEVRELNREFKKRRDEKMREDD